MAKKRKFIRYHNNVYFPESFSNMLLEFIDTLHNEVDLTQHAAEEMHNSADKRGYIPLPTNTELLHHSNKIVEYYERVDRPGRIQKAVFRVSHLNEKYDYSYVVARGGIVVTAWANSKNDHHRLTESLHKYYCPSSIKDEVYKKIIQEDADYVKKDNL